MASPKLSKRSDVKTSKKGGINEGACFKAIWVECDRKGDRRVYVKASEIHTVIDEDTVNVVQYTDISSSRKNACDGKSYEIRKIAMASPFEVKTPPAYLHPRKTQVGNTVIHVEPGSLPATFFPPMAATKPSGVHRETNAVEVIFGIDPSIGHHWVTPIALKHIEDVRERVVEAGGLFVADFDTSIGGWAKFRTLYICPAPSSTLYVQSFKIKTRPLECWGQRRVEPRLSSAGGKLFKRRFEPASTDVDDPVIFRDIDSVLGM